MVSERSARTPSRLKSQSHRSRLASTNSTQVSRLFVRSMPNRLIGAIAAAGIAVGALVATSAMGAPLRPGGSGTRIAWIVSDLTLQRIAKLDPSLARYFFDNQRTFAIAGKIPPRTSSAPNSLKTMSFADETLLRDAIVSHRLVPGTRAVIYDDEDWTLTPRDQQLHPARYYHEAAAVAHRHGLLLIATPATDLVNALAPGTPNGQKYSEFLKLGIAAAAACDTDVYKIQAQGSEEARSTYRQFVRAAGAQARRAHPGVELLAGISTNPSGRMETPSVLFNAVQATRSIVAGYWLNDPANGKACPKCTGPYPQIAVAFLQMLRAG